MNANASIVVYEVNQYIEEKVVKYEIENVEEDRESEDNERDCKKETQMVRQHAGQLISMNVNSFVL